MQNSEFESLPEHMRNLEEDAKRLFKEYSFLVLKTCRIGMTDLSDYEKEVMDKALELHREELKRKLDGSA
jgi:hypothetical protein